jgi:DNA-directed RNA polymerase specialized sigma24 family protein
MDHPSSHILDHTTTSSSSNHQTQDILLQGPPVTDWKKKTVLHWATINCISKRRFANETLAEEAALYVLEKLEQDNWRRLKEFQNRSSFKTFLSSLTFRLLEDFSRKKFGRVRAPLWVQKLGGIWNLLFTFLCLERLSPQDAIEHTIVRMPALETQDIENAAWEIREKIIDCGTHQSQDVEFDEEMVMEEQGNPHSPIQSNLESQEKILLFSALFKQLFNNCKEAPPESAVTALDEIPISLSSEERLLLKLCYRDGVRVTEAGRMLGYKRFQIHGKMRRLLSRLRNTFQKAGVDEIIQQMLKD